MADTRATAIGRQEPPKPRRLHVRIARIKDRLQLTYRNRQWVAGCFLSFWLVGWSVGCVFLAAEVVKDPKPLTVLFAIPFWAAWFFVSAMVAKMTLEREEFAISHEGVQYRRSAVIMLETRDVPLSEIEGFESFSRVTDSESGQVESGIAMRTRGKPLRFAAGLPDAERNWLMFQLDDCLRALQDSRPESAFGHPPDFAALPDQREAEHAEILAYGRTPVLPPSDNSWHRLDDFHAVEFVQRGRWHWGAVLGLLFVNAFWNGIVSVFIVVLFSDDVDKPQGMEWWGLLVFLIPFEVIGLAMFGGLLLAVLEPVRRAAWKFADAFIEWRWTWFGFGPRSTYWIDRLDRIELTGTETFKGKRFRDWLNSSTDQVDDTPYRLSLIDKDNVEVCTIANLTQGEARWMGDIVRRERARWFG